MSNAWRPPFVPAHRRPRDRFKAAQLAPVQRVVAVVCTRAGCGHLRLIHRDNRICLTANCDCPSFVEEPDA